MEPRTRKRLTIGWSVVLVAMVLPFPLAPLVNVGGIASFAWFAAIPLAIITFRRSGHDQHLQRPGWYRAALIVQLLVAILGMVTAAHTVYVDDRIGLVSVATVQLVAAIATWRAIAKPDARRAIASALVGELVTLAALIIDLALDTDTSGVRTHRVVFFDIWTALALSSVFLSWVAGGLVCLASINAFGARTNLPDARAV